MFRIFLLLFLVSFICVNIIPMIVLRAFAVRHVVCCLVATTTIPPSRTTQLLSFLHVFLDIMILRTTVYINILTPSRHQFDFCCTSLFDVLVVLFFIHYDRQYRIPYYRLLLTVSWCLVVVLPYYLHNSVVMYMYAFFFVFVRSMI
jgi:hypothetical protein